MLRMTTCKDPSLLSDVEWDVTVKKKPMAWKSWVRCTIFFFLILIVLGLVVLFMFGFVYRHDFLGFVKLKPLSRSIPHPLINQKIHAGTMRMAAKLFNEPNSNENTVWSPLTVTLALNLLLEGTTGETAYEIKSAMGWIGIDKTHIRSYVSRVTTRLNHLDNLDIIVANRIFLDNSYDVSTSYKNILSQHYRANIDQIDFNNADAVENINRWGRKESRGQIKELIPLGTIDAATKLVLSTFLTFNGRWKLPFSPNHTQKAEFTLTSGKKRKVDMMYQTGRFMYGEFPAHGFKALELEYIEPNISMTVLLSQRISHLKALLYEQDGKMLINIRNKMKKDNVDVCLPKFTVETGRSIEHQLSSLGIRRLFTPTAANLQSITDNSELYVQKIIHRVKMQVDESGTVGQASSSSVLEGRSLTPSFCADRPFLFYVEDKEMNSVLFWGEYNGSK